MLVQQRIRQVAPWALLAGAVALLIIFQTELRAQGNQLIEYIQLHPYSGALLYVVVFALGTSLSVPGKSRAIHPRNIPSSTPHHI
eukprot:jgi/Hompol1/5466/HPOL_004461-RA